MKNYTLGPLWTPRCIVNVCTASDIVYVCLCDTGVLFIILQCKEGFFYIIVHYYVRIVPFLLFLNNVLNRGLYTHVLA